MFFVVAQFDITQNRVWGGGTPPWGAGGGS